MSARRPGSQRYLLPLSGLLLACTLASPIFADTAAPQYDPNGNLKETQVPGGTLGYTYDALDRLKSEFGPGVDQSFTYDINGNRTGDATHGYTITPDGNRIQAIDGVTVIYDPAGNILDDGQGKTFTYNAAGRLKEVRVNNTLVASYKYNYRGQRTHKITPQGTTLYHYDLQGHLIQTSDLQGAPQQSLHWADDQPIAQVDHAPGGDKLVYLHADQLNTPRTATDPAGTIVWRWEGKAFGESAPNPDPDGDGNLTTVNLRYAGQYFDAETGLHYNWHRYYDPKTGRYISSDPIGLAGGLNTYTYGYNNPLKYIDPDGQNPLIVQGILRLLQIGLGALTIATDDVPILGGGAASKVCPVPKSVMTPRGPAVQAMTPEAQAALREVQSGATVFRQGEFGVQQTSGGQFWSLQNPATTPGYAGQMGMPGATTPKVDWMMGGTVKPGSSVITRPAPGIGGNPGGSMEAVVAPGGVEIQWFHMP